ncbi:MAG: glycosyltransferase family 39 protein [Solirubrobacterales bacterium]|nr:glycosyltransferase family 39 protein [Solirubrobacterales bacterium]
MSATLERPRGSASSRASVQRPSGAPHPARPSRRPRILDVATVALPCLLAAGLVFYELAARSLWLDEAATVSIASQHGAALWHAIAHDGGNLLGYYLLEHVLTGWFGHAPELIRLPSALATVGTVALSVLLARRLFDRRVAFASGVLVAMSLPLVFWGQDARGYALMVMFIVASFLALARMLDAPRVSRYAWAAYAAALVLAIYMSFVAALVVPAQLLVVLVGRRRRLQAVASALAAVAALCVPIVVLAAARGSGQLFWVPVVDVKRIDEMLRWLVSAGLPPNVHRSSSGTPLLAITLLALVVPVVRLLRRPAWQPALLLSWLLVPLALALIESLIGQPVALARTSLVALPAVSLLLAWGLLSDDPRSRALPIWLGWSVVAVLIALRALQLAPSYGASPENWKAAARYVGQRTQAGDCIAFYPLDGRMAFDFYASGRGFRAPLPAPVLPAVRWGVLRPYVERYATLSTPQTAPVAARCSRLWLIASHEGQPDGPPPARANLARYRALQAELARVYPRRTAAKFGWASPVRVDLLQ